MTNDDMDFLEVEVVKMRLSDMILPEYNPRKDIRKNPIFYQRLHDSLRKLSYSDLIVVNKRNNLIVSGNQRYKVICDIVTSNGKNLEDVEIAVILVDFDEPTEWSANLTYNHLGGEDDEELMGELLAKIEVADKDMLDITGIEVDEIRELIDKLDNPIIEADDSSDKVKETDVYDDKIAVIEVKLKIPHEYYEVYKNFVKENTDAPLVQAVIKVIMSGGSNITR